ncbi:MAG: hypothetical protein Q7J16_00040 [Candidatus Cloacimonadales bacterium]|nr:hypothetical protein [Candidatus Cloacimonadales bacterium]
MKVIRLIGQIIKQWYSIVAAILSLPIIINWIKPGIFDEYLSQTLSDYLLGHNIVTNLSDT